MHWAGSRTALKITKANTCNSLHSQILLLHKLKSGKWQQDDDNDDNNDELTSVDNDRNTTSKIVFLDAMFVLRLSKQTTMDPTQRYNILFQY